MDKAKKDVRRSIMLTQEMEDFIVRLRMQERYTRLSYAEIIRMLIQTGITAIQDEKSA